MRMRKLLVDRIITQYRHHCPFNQMEKGIIFEERHNTNGFNDRCYRKWRHEKELYEKRMRDHLHMCTDIKLLDLYMCSLIGNIYEDGMFDNDTFDINEELVEAEDGDGGHDPPHPHEVQIGDLGSIRIDMESTEERLRRASVDDRFLRLGAVSEQAPVEDGMTHWYTSSSSLGDPMSHWTAAFDEFDANERDSGDDDE